MFKAFLSPYAYVRCVIKPYLSRSVGTELDLNQCGPHLDLNNWRSEQGQAGSRRSVSPLVRQGRKEPASLRKGKKAASFLTLGILAAL